MSLGIGGTAKIIQEDSDVVVYIYAPYDLNDEQHRNPQMAFDGIIWIQKNALVEPSIHKKIVRMPSGHKKESTKCIKNDVDFVSLFQTGKIIVENSSFCFNILPTGTGMIAMRCIFKIFDYYQDNGQLPERIDYHA